MPDTPGRIASHACRRPGRGSTPPSAATGTFGLYGVRDLRQTQPSTARTALSEPGCGAGRLQRMRAPIGAGEAQP